MSKRSKVSLAYVVASGLNTQTHRSSEPTVEALQEAGIISSPPKRKRAAGGSPALRIACPVCRAQAGDYCTKTIGSKPFKQTISHKRRRQEEERTR